MSITPPSSPPLPQQPEAPIDPALLARMANALFAALPTEIAGPSAFVRQQAPGTPPTTVPSPSQTSPLVGVQAPVNVAPPGSPLASPAGLGPAVPGTPLPQGTLPGANLLPASPTPLASLVHRAPALQPHAQAGNGVPDALLGTLPAYEPRLGSQLQGVPPVPASTPRPGALPANAPQFYWQQPVVPGPEAAPDSQLDQLAREPFALGTPFTLDLPGQREPQPLANGGPRYYFVEQATPAEDATKSPRDHAPAVVTDRHPPFDVHAIRRDFPILQERVNGRPLVWFDNAATTHKPLSVIERLAHFYAHENSNIHRAAHELAARATDAYEGAREKVRAFLNAPEVNEVIFVRGTTEAINLVAKSWGTQHVGEGDEIIVSHLEHHANIVPWQQLAAAKGARLRVIPVDDSGQVLLDEYRRLLNDRTRIVAVTQVSNALGTVVPVKEIVDLAHRAGAKALVDGAQSVSHLRVDVQALDADFFVFSGHKIFGPTGIGVLWGKREVLEDMPPWQGGGNMIADVTFEKTVFQPIPNKFEAGTGNIADAVGLGAALDYVSRLGLENIARYEHDLLEYGMQQLATLPGVRLIGTAAEKTSVMSFVLAGFSTEEVGRALNEEGIAVRTGHHCAQPILRRFGVEATVRPSLAFYNTHEEIDRLIDVVKTLANQRRRG